MPRNRILLDNNVPLQLAQLLSRDEVVHASRMGWAAIVNGELIRAAQADGFAIMITCDQNIRYQQNLAGQPLSFIVLATTHWPTIRDNVAKVVAAVDAAVPGSFEAVALPKPPKRRRPFPLPTGP